MRSKISKIAILALPLVCLLFPLRQEAVPTVNPDGEKYVALTFDDGPSRSTTAQLLDGLQERGAHATFFVIGEQIAGNEELIRRMQAEGHQVGNHTYTHVRLDQSRNAMREIGKTQETLSSILGEGNYWLRPPWGFMNRAAAQKIAVPMLYWSIDTDDWRIKDAAAIEKHILDNVKDGDVILLHEGYPTSVAATLSAIDALSEEGYQFVTVDELFARAGVTAQKGVMYRRADTVYRFK